MPSRRLVLRPTIMVAFAAGAIVSGARSEPMEAKNNRTMFEGVLWTRYSYTIEDPSTTNRLRDTNGFAVDRVYLTLSGSLGDRTTGRVRIEMSNQNTGQIRTFLETADITIRRPFGIGDARLRFGQTEGLISSFLEGPWGYRAVAPTTTERYFGIPTTYLGAGLSKSWFGDRAATDLLVANRAGYDRNVSADGNPKYKTFGARAYLSPVIGGSLAGLGVGGYVQVAPAERPSADNRTLWSGVHLFYEGAVAGRPFVVGSQIDGRNLRADSGMDRSALILSGLARAYLTDRIEIFGRVDIVDFDTDKEDLVLPGPDVASGVFEAGLAQRVIVAGISRAYSKTLRAIVDFSLRSFTDEIILQEPRTVLETDSEMIVSVRLDARL